MKFSTIEDCIRNNATVAMGTKAGLPMEEIVMLLCSQHEDLVRRLAIQEAISPKKIQKLDGSWLIYRCPNELVPEIPSPFTRRP